MKSRPSVDDDDAQHISRSICRTRVMGIGCPGEDQDGVAMSDQPGAQRGLDCEPHHFVCRAVQVDLDRLESELRELL